MSGARDERTHHNRLDLFSFRIRSSTTNHQFQVKARTEQKAANRRKTATAKSTRSTPKASTQQNRTAQRKEEQSQREATPNTFYISHLLCPTPTHAHPVLPLITQMKTLGAPRGHNPLRPFSSGDRGLPRGTWELGRIQYAIASGREGGP